MGLVFDGATKIISLTSGTTLLDVRDVYSRWKDWVISGDNAKWPQAFAIVGGEPIDPGAGTSIPPYAFLLNGWQVRPQEAPHTLFVSGGVLLVDGGGNPIAATLGAFQVQVNYQQPVQAIGIAGAASVGAIAAAVLAATVENGLSLAEVLRIHNAILAGRVSGANTGTERFRNLADSKDRVVVNADADGNRTGVSIDASEP